MNAPSSPRGTQRSPEAWQPAELLCDVRFDPASAGSWLLPGRFYERVRDRFPTIEQPAPVQPGQATGWQIALPARFRSADGTRLVQLAPGQLVVNHVEPPPGELSLADAAAELLAGYAALLRDPAVRQVTTRAIHAAPPRPPVGMPELGPPLQEPPSAFLGRLQWSAPEEDEPSVAVQWGSALDEQQRPRLVLDVEVSRRAPSLSADDVPGWAEWLRAGLQLALEASEAARPLLASGGVRP